MNTKSKTLTKTESEQMEEARLQEHTTLQVEDTSLPAEQILVIQREQEGRSSLYVP